MKRAVCTASVLLLLVIAGNLTACDFIEDTFGNEKEAQGIVELIGENALTMDGTEYRVTDKTEYEGFTGLDDIAVGDEVEIEYKEDGGDRVAVEIERAGAEDAD